MMDRIERCVALRDNTPYVKIHVAGYRVFLGSYFAAHPYNSGIEEIFWMYFGLVVGVLFLVMQIFISERIRQWSFNRNPTSFIVEYKGLLWHTKEKFPSDRIKSIDILQINPEESKIVVQGVASYSIVMKVSSDVVQQYFDTIKVFLNP